MNDLYNLATSASLIWIALELDSKVIAELKIIDNDGIIVLMCISYIHQNLYITSIYLRFTLQG